MRSRIDYRLSAALLSLTLLGGSTCLGQQPSTEEVLGFDPEITPCCPLAGENILDQLHSLVQTAVGRGPCTQPLAFDFAAPTQCSCGGSVALCGHVCDGQRCYETEDAAGGSPVAAELAAQAKEDLNFRIETREVAPPMPTLRTKQTAAAATAEAPARCELGSPAEAAAAQTVAAGSPTYGPEMLEIVRLRCELDAAQQRLQTQSDHHAEVLALIEQLHEAKTLAAEVTARQESREQFCKNWGGLVEQHFKTIAERSVLQSEHAGVERLHASELEAVRLKAELAAAKEWISHRLAAEQAVPAPVVGFPFPAPPVLIPPGAIPAPLAVYEPQYVAAEAEAAPAARPWQRQPVPFAFGTYAPQEWVRVTPASAGDDAACTACTQACPAAAACGTCSDAGCPASAASACPATKTVAAAAGCQCQDCDREACSCDACECVGCECGSPAGTVLPGVVRTDGGICGQIVVCPAAEAANAEACVPGAEPCGSQTAEANVARRADESAESR